MTKFPFSDSKLIHLVKSFGEYDAQSVENNFDQYPDRALEEFLDRAWYSSGYVHLKENKDLGRVWEECENKINLLSLENVYKTAFKKTALSRQ